MISTSGKRSKTTVMAVAAFTVTAVLAAESSAQECAGYEGLEPLLIAEVNTRLPFEEEISRRKKFIVHEVEELDISGCDVEMRARVTLTRKIRRDASGNIRLHARISEVDVGRRRACLSDVNVDEVNVSNTLRIGENRYERALNRRFDSLCISPEGVVLNAPVCADAVQGRIAWDYSGSTRWNSENVDRLCAGAEASTEPAQCFQRVMHSGVDWGGGTRWQWGNAIDLCEGTNSADTTISCFRSRIADGSTWSSAIRECEV